jgi:hypothetical protein
MGLQVCYAPTEVPKSSSTETAPSVELGKMPPPCCAGATGQRPRPDAVLKACTTDPSSNAQSKQSDKPRVGLSFPWTPVPISDEDT